jgi:16S rRNA C967 or C1407 C5-methylase (RsmB/RsmF family)/NOL1/NOP2/fmu family ribosome biogenesis protein
VQLPIQLLDSLEGVRGFNRPGFEEVHASGQQVTSIRVNPTKNTGRPLFPDLITPVPWTQHGYYLSTRPSFTFDPLFHAGRYYVQEASSMFLEQAITQSTEPNTALKVIDLCAAPGGKSTHVQSLLPEGSLLVSNEVIRARANVLKDNIVKWGSSNVMVTSNDPSDFASLENFFDVLIVDAPCSGSGLFRRDEEAIDEWSLNNVALCSQRQQRILAAAWPCLKKNGLLIYSTCSYSKEEDEDIVQWLTKELGAAVMELNVPGEWNIVPSAGGYRFWPDKILGEGLFLCCLRKKDGEERPVIRAKKIPPRATKNELEMVNRWVEPADLSFIKYENTVYAWPGALLNDFSIILERLKTVYSGTLVGELMRDKIVPGHALAMSALINKNIPEAGVPRETAIQYLQRKDVSLASVDKGWQRVMYEGNSLGWINILANRINNYYPKELRILKDK